jgi:uncharacterized protein YggE
MNKGILMALSLFLVCLNPFAGTEAGEKSGIMRGSITSEGRAEDNYPPDTVTIVLAVETMTLEASGSAEKNRAITGRVIDQLKELIIPDRGDSIQTISYSLDPVHEYEQVKKIRVFRGYRVINRIGVKLNTIDSAGTVIDTAIGGGANRVDSIQFSLSDNRQYCSELIAQASARAKADALAAAAPLGTSLKGLKDADVRCGAESVRPVYSAGIMREADFAAQPSTPIEAGTIKLHAAVRAIFFIDDE